MDSGNDLIGNRLAHARYQRFGARLWFGLICSLAVHGLILSMQFGIPGLGLPGLSLPWAERRALAPELSVTLAGVKPAEDAVPPPNPLPAEPAPSVAPGALQVVPHAQHEPRPSATSPIRSKSRKSNAPPKARPAARPKALPPVIARTEPSPDSFKVPAPEPKEQPDDANIEAPPLVQESPAPAPVPAPAEEKPAMPLAPEPDAQLAKLEEQQRDEARKLEEVRQQREARKLEEARKIEEARRAEEARKEEARKIDESNMLRRAAEAEARKREEQEAVHRAAALAARQEEAKRQEQEQTERKALEMEARRKSEEAARQQAAALERQKQAEQLAAKAKADELAARLKAEEAVRRQQAEQLAAKQQAELAERQRAEAAAAQQRETERRAAQEAQAATAAAAAEAAAARNAQKAAAPGPLAGGDLASKALSQARKLDLARVEPPPVQPPVAGNPERPVRRSIFGKLDNDIGLSMYIQGWRLKIERNGRLNYSQSSRDRARGDPIVTVALRSDGSVEDIVINRSSGRPELDEAVRRIVRLNARYAAFPPALAHRFDVIEIRRIWSFEDSLKILEELETH